MKRLLQEMEMPYREALRDILSFSTFARTEQTIRSLENLCRNYRLASDKKGVEYCRRVAYLGRQRAELISRNRKVAPEKRLHKKEVATWFKIWLETPALFDDWLSMRKDTAEFRELLAFESGGGLKSGGRDASGN